MADPVVLIAGAGQAGLQTAQALRLAGFAGTIRLIGDEPELPYGRPPLSKGFLTEAVDAAGLALTGAGVFAEQAIDWIAGRTIAAIDRPGRRVTFTDAEALDYDHLVLATGSRCRRLTLPGAGRAGVVELRTLADARHLAGQLAATRRIVVIGAGFIGLEVAATARARGAEVTIIELADRPMARAVSVPTGQAFAAAHQAAGISFRFGSGVRALHGAGEDGRVDAVELADGTHLPADLVLVGIGAQAEDRLATAAGLPTRDGVLVDAALRTEDPAISAIGDCARFPSPYAPQAGLVRLESVQNAVDQARHVAARIVGGAALPYAAAPWFWSEQGTWKLQIAGLGAGHDRTVTRGDPASGKFAVYCFAGDRLAAVETIGRPAEHVAARRLFAAHGGLPPVAPDRVAAPDFDLKQELTALAR